MKASPLIRVVRPVVLALSLTLLSGCTHAPPPAPADPAPVIAAAAPSVPEPLGGQFKPGQKVVVTVRGFDGAGTVLLDGVAHKAVGWASDHVTIRVPDGPPGKTFVVALLPQGASQAIPAGSITLAAPNLFGSTGGSIAAGGGGGQVRPAVPPPGGSPSHSKGPPLESHYIPPNSPR